MNSVLEEAIREGRQKLSASSPALLDRLKAKDSATKQPKPLNIVILGGGICGLATSISLANRGHHVELFEEKEKISAIGAGIQVLPNTSGCLQRLGVFHLLENALVHPEHLMIRRWENGAPVGKVRTKDMKRWFGSPFVQVHRGDLCDALYSVAKEKGVIFNLSMKAIEFDFDAPSVTFENGTVKRCELVIVADGINSFARSKILKEPLKPEAKFAALRALVDTEVIQRDSDLKWLVEVTAQNCWVGPDRHCMTYSVKGGNVLNMVFIAPLDSAKRGTTPSDVQADLAENFGQWDPTLQRLLKLIKDPTKWPVWMAPHLPSPTAPGQKVIALGDAAHDMTPFLGQGAAMAVEDAVVLGRVLDCARDASDVPGALEIFEAIRVPRTSAIKRQALRNVDLWHMHDGAQQQERDAGAHAEVTEEVVTHSPYIWSDPEGMKWLFEYDLEDVISRLQNQA